MPIVYKLIDPRDNRIYYVGYTEIGLTERLLGHLSIPKHKTTLDLINNGLKPDIQVIEESDRVTKETEMYWIKRISRENVFLENKDGIVNYQNRDFIFEIPENLLDTVDMSTELRYKSAIEIVLNELPLSPSIPLIIRIKTILEWALKIESGSNFKEELK